MNKRSYNWKHCSLIGAVSSAQANMARIIRAESTTPETQARAAMIANDLAELEKLIRSERVNQDGSRSKLK